MAGLMKDFGEKYVCCCSSIIVEVYSKNLEKPKNRRKRANDSILKIYFGEVYWWNLLMYVTHNMQVTVISCLGVYFRQYNLTKIHLNFCTTSTIIQLQQHTYFRQYPSTTLNQPYWR